MPSVDGFGIYIMNFWDDDLTELWHAKHVIGSQTVKEFLLKQRINTFENGFIEIVVHSVKGDTNLVLESHKKIQLHTKDEEIFNAFSYKIMDLGYKQTRDFYSLEFNFHHFHYRLADSLTRTEFKTMLLNNEFEQIRKWEE